MLTFHPLQYEGGPAIRRADRVRERGTAFIRTIEIKDEQGKVVERMAETRALAVRAALDVSAVAIEELEEEFSYVEKC